MTNAYAFADLFKNAWDFNQLFATQRRNIEALSAANQAMVEGAQAVSRLQAEVLRDNVGQVLKASRDLFSTGGSPEVNVTKQAEVARDVLESTLNNVREVTELLTKSSFEVFDVLNRRASESLDELSKASTTATQKKKAA